MSEMSKLEELMGMIDSSPVPEEFDDDSSFDADEAAEAELFGIGPEDFPSDKKVRRSFAVNSDEKAQNGPVLSEAPEPYVADMYKRSLAGNAKLLTGNPHKACGCYSCKKIFPESKVIVRKKTLYCPRCHQQTVIPGGDGWSVADGVLWRVWAYYRAFGDRTVVSEK